LKELNLECKERREREGGGKRKKEKRKRVMRIGSGRSKELKTQAREMEGKRRK